MTPGVRASGPQETIIWSLRPGDDPAGVADCPVAVCHGTLADWAPRPGDGVGWPELLGADGARYAAMLHGEVRARFAAARRLLKHLCAARLGVDPADLMINYQPGGRPCLAGDGMPHISISHTRDLVAAAVSAAGPVGVDVEHAHRPVIEYGLLPRICTHQEQADLRAMPAHRRNRHLVHLWTLKEAYVKALGQGLAADFRDVGFSPRGDHHGPVTPLRGDGGGDGVPGGEAAWRFRLAALPGGYALACAVHLQEPAAGQAAVRGGERMSPTVAVPGAEVAR